jgi:hypothetical protein
VRLDELLVARRRRRRFRLLTGGDRTGEEERNRFGDDLHALAPFNGKTGLVLGAGQYFRLVKRLLLEMLYKLFSSLLLRPKRPELVLTGKTS